MFFADFISLSRAITLKLFRSGWERIAQKPRLKLQVNIRDSLRTQKQRGPILEGTKFKKLENFFTGPTAIALSQDAISSAKILTKFAKANSNLKIIGGLMGDDLLKVEDVAKIATLPTLEEARSKILGILSAPAQKIMTILLAPGLKIAILAHAKSKKS